ncbi:MAG: YfbK domain-containing protein [Limisphaerales bacterium]
MSSDETPNQSSREELEERVIALLMGELDSAAADEIEAALEEDSQLREFHGRMQKTFGLVQEAVSGAEISKAPTPLKLSPERRDELFSKLDRAKRAGQPDNVVELRRGRRRKWVTGLAIAASLAVLLALVVAPLERATKPAIAHLRDLDPAVVQFGDDSEYFASATTSTEPTENEAQPARVRLQRSAQTKVVSTARRSMESHLSNRDAKEAMNVGLSRAQTGQIQKLLQPTSDSKLGIAAFESTAAADSPADPISLAAISAPEPMRNIRVDDEKSSPAPVALNIVLPERAKERDERSSRGQFFDRVPKSVTRWEDQSGLASRDGEDPASSMDPFTERSLGLAVNSEKKLPAEHGSSEMDGGLAGDFSTFSGLSDEIRKAPRFVGSYGRQPGSAGSADTVSFGAMPPTGGPQPLGEVSKGMTPKLQTSSPSFAFSGTRTSGYDEVNGKAAINQPTSGPSTDDLFTSRQDIVRESVPEDAMLFDTEARFDRKTARLSKLGQSVQAPANAPAIVTATPAPTMGVEFLQSGIGGGMGGGGGGIQDQRRMYKLQTPSKSRSGEAKSSRLSELAAADDSLASVVERGRKRGGQVGGQSKDQSWGQNPSVKNFSIPGVSMAGGGRGSQQGRPQQQGQQAAGPADGFGINLSSRRSSSGRGKVAADKSKSSRAEFDAEMPELELREQQVTRELAQKRKAIESVLSKQVAQLDQLQRRQVAMVPDETESLAEHLVDLQSMLAGESQKVEAENKQRLLVEDKRLGGMVSGLGTSARGVQGPGNSDYGMKPGSDLRGELRTREKAAAPASGPNPTGFESGVAGFRQQNQEAGGTTHYRWTGLAKPAVPTVDNVPRVGALFGQAAGSGSQPPAAEATKKQEVAKLVRDGKAYQELRQFDAAEKKLKEAVKLDPENDAAYYHLRVNLEAQYDQENRAKDHMFHERVVEVSEAWNRKTENRETVKRSSESSGPAPAATRARGWAFQARDNDGDGNSLVSKDSERSVEKLFVDVSSVADRVGNKVVSGEEAIAVVDFDDDAIAGGGDPKKPARPNHAAWMVQAQDQDQDQDQDQSRRYFRQPSDGNIAAPKALAWREQRVKPADQPDANRQLLRRLSLDVAGQAPSPAAAEEFLKRSGGEVTRRTRDNKKALGDVAKQRGNISLASDLGRKMQRTKGLDHLLGLDLPDNAVKNFVLPPSQGDSTAVTFSLGTSSGNGVLLGVNDSGVDRSQQAIGGRVIVEGTNGFAGGTHVPGIVRFAPQETPPTSGVAAPATPQTVAALIPPPVTTLMEESEVAKPQPKVRPKKPKTLEPKPEILTKENAFSTFSLNVSDVAFKLASASLKAGKLPDPETVRSEEFLNALDYHDPAPRGSEKLAFAWDRARNPFAHNRDFLRFSIQTAAQGRESGQPLNLVVLLDASGSMERADRLAIVRQMLSVLAGQLKPTDRISVVAFARTPWLLVDGMKGGQPKDLLDRVINITPQGGTNIEIGLDLAYIIAHRHYLANGNNRVIVLTDGAANLGNVNPEQLKAKVEEQRKKNVALDCFGVGWEGYNDDLLETLSRNGDGRYGFVNDPTEARDGFADLLAGALQVSAANVKAQIEFNPKRVIGYRQIGYTKHQLKKEQFRDNTVDAAEIGAAESGTAMYSIQTDRHGTGPIATVRVRYKIPATGRYVEEEWELPYDPAQPLENAKPSMRLATVAASFAEWMAANPHAGSVSLGDLQRYLTGVPEEFSSDERPKQLRTMLQQARRISGE